MEESAHRGGSVGPVLCVRFGPFELDLRGGELHKEGRRIRLQEQPFQILQMLLESPGEVVSREEIRKRLWPDNTVVEFDHSINAAVKRLRDALRDSAAKPRYIETVARRGYRFTAELETAGKPTPVNEPAAVIPINAASAQPAKPFPRHFRIYTFALLAMIVVIASAGAWYFRAARPFIPPLRPLMRLDVDLGNELSPGSDRGANAIISPDGTRLVYVSQSKLFTRPLDGAAAAELPGTEGAQAPFFSPDGRWVAFFAGAKLKKISLQGGRPIALCDSPLPNGASWGEDGNIVAATDFRLSRIPSAGGRPMPITELAPGELSHRWPQLLPGAKAVLFTAYPSMSGSEGATIEALSFRDGRRRTLVRGGTWGRYAPTGHLLYINKGTLFALSFDPNRLEIRGAPMPVLKDVAYSAAWGSAQLDFSRTGTLVYRSAKTGAGLVTVQWLDAAGNTQPLLPVPGNYLSPTLSPDGSRLAVTSGGDIWVYELGRGSMTRLTFGGGYGNPLWSADGRYIVFRAARNMMWTRADGSGQPQTLIQSRNRQFPWSFTGDGRRLAFVEPNAPPAAAIWTVSIESDASGLGAGTPQLFLQGPFHERCPMLSPDGRWLAYMSNESGGPQVYVQSFPGKHGKRQISTDNGGYPAWARHGNELFFWHWGASNQLMAVSYKASGDSFMADKPRLWAGKRLAAFNTTRAYDPAPDGKRVVALMPADAPQERQDRVTFLLNFFDELRRRATLSAN